MDASEVGKYGTLRLMKRLEPEMPVASFPIDDETVTFGRDPHCSIRLYYPDVSSIHAKLVFQERKAFIVILGMNGLLIDGCPVYPSDNSSLPTTIPVSNNSEIEIHNKRFIFTYPPKAMRAALFDSPVKSGPETPGTRRRALRMSMIYSAEVFTPQPSKNPRENLRILQSPLRRPGDTVKNRSSHLARSDPHEDQDEEEIILVDGDNPRVVEEEKDLIILESVEVDDASQPFPPESQVDMVNHPSHLAPQTPRRRMHGRPSLHRAVLLRSAQRATMKVEMEEEEEEKEVEEFIAEDVKIEEQSGNVRENDDEVSNCDSEGQSLEEDGDARRNLHPGRRESGWRVSLSAVKEFAWPFRASSIIPEENDDFEGPGDADRGGEEDIEVDEDHDIVQEHDEAPHEQETTNIPPPTATPTRLRPLSQFMTPQVNYVQDLQADRGAGRYSLGGAQRVRLEPKWKVADIIVPLPSDKSAGNSYPSNGHFIKEEARKATVSEDERKAIRDRRKSALTTPDPIFGSHIPGLSARPSVPASPVPISSLFSARNIISPVKPSLHEWDSSEGDEEEDTRSMLDKMKKTVEDMKRRRSVGPNVNPETYDEDHMAMNTLDTESADQASLNQQPLHEDWHSQDEGSDKENDGAIGSDIKYEEKDIINDPDELSSDEMNISHTKEEPGAASTYVSPATFAPHVESNDPHTPSVETLKHVFPAPPAGPSTTAVTSIRTLFRTDQHASSMQTPRMDGVREMYLREGRREATTPSFDGLDDLLETPQAYRRIDGPREQHENAHSGHPGIRDALVKATRVARPVCSGTSALTGYATRRTTARMNNVALDSVVPDASKTESEVVTEQASADIPNGRTVAQGISGDGPETRTKARLLRSRRGVANNNEENDVPQQDTEPSKSLSSKVNRTKGVKKEEAPGSLHEVALKTIPSVRSRSAPKANTNPKATNSEPAKPIRRTRLQNQRDTPIIDDKPSTSAKPMRKGRLGPKQTKPDSVEVTAVASKPGSRSKAIQLDVDGGDDHDPLDSIAQTDKYADVERSAKPLQGKRTMVKHESDDGLLEAKTRRAPVRAAAKAASSNAKPRTKTITTMTATSATNVTDSPTCPSDGLDGGINKENTPSVDEEESAVTANTTTASTSKSNAPGAKADVAAPKARNTRAVRAKK